MDDLIKVHEAEQRKLKSHCRKILEKKEQVFQLKKQVLHMAMLMYISHCTPVLQYAHEVASCAKLWHCIELNADSEAVRSEDYSVAKKRYTVALTVAPAVAPAIAPAVALMGHQLLDWLLD